MVVGKHRPTVETIDLEAISWNIQQIRKSLSPEKKFFAVVKADAYGLGAVPVAVLGHAAAHLAL